jgi:hypothetical protein
MRKLVAVALFTAVIAASQSKTLPCDRACLEGIVQQYLDALVAHNPFGLPLAPKIKFSENDQLLELGDGLWNVTTAVGSYRLVLSDPQSGQVGFLGTAKENDVPVGLALRLKIENRRITEIESLVIRDTGVGAALDALGKPDAGFLTTVPVGERISRAAINAALDKYVDAIEQGNGEPVPFDPQCDGILNGVQATHNPALKLPWLTWNPFELGCRDLMNTKFFSYIQRIYPRRHVIVDEERQVAMGIFMIQVPGDILSVNTPTHGKVEYPADYTTPYFQEVFEAYKFNRGKIRHVDALMSKLPYGTPNPYFKDTWRSPKKEK